MFITNYLNRQYIKQILSAKKFVFCLHLALKLFFKKMGLISPHIRVSYPFILHSTQCTPLVFLSQVTKNRVFQVPEINPRNGLNAICNDEQPFSSFLKYLSIYSSIDLQKIFRKIDFLAWIFEKKLQPSKTNILGPCHITMYISSATIQFTICTVLLSTKKY